MMLTVEQQLLIIPHIEGLVGRKRLGQARITLEKSRQLALLTLEAIGEGQG